MIIKMLGLCLFLISLSAHCEDYYGVLNLGLRYGAFEATLGKNLFSHVGSEITYSDEGKQPDNIPNINRVISMDLVGRHDLFWGFSGYIKSGISASHQNGGGYSAFSGTNVGVGLTYPLSKNVDVDLSAMSMRYKQCDVPEFERFTTVTAGIKINF